MLPRAVLESPLVERFLSGCDKYDKDAEANAFAKGADTHREIPCIPQTVRRLSLGLQKLPRLPNLYIMDSVVQVVVRDVWSNRRLNPISVRYIVYIALEYIEREYM